jgi:hypothetical protein
MQPPRSGEERDMANNQNGHELPPELANVADEYDRTHHAELMGDYEPLFEVFRQMHLAHPEWRFGQMIVNLASWSDTAHVGDAYQVPDERLLEVAREHLDRLRSESSTPVAASSRR